jgi:hypothetical protein
MRSRLVVCVAKAVFQRGIKHMPNVWMVAVVVTGVAVAAEGCSADAGPHGVTPPEVQDPGVGIDPAAVGENGMTGAPEHVFLKRGEAHGGSGPLMTYHSGPVLTANKTQAIYWGTSWKGYAGDKISGLASFFEGFGGTAYASIMTEYSSITNSSTYLGATTPGPLFDYSAAPTQALSTSSAVAEACKLTGNNPDPNALYLIYTDTGAGNVNYCAWHSWGQCGGTRRSPGNPIQVAYMPNLDAPTGDAAPDGVIPGCDPFSTEVSMKFQGGSTWTDTVHSPGLVALVNVTAHELSETITDPRGNAWYDSGKNEIGDKCAWSFWAPVTLSNGSEWKLQMEWSNAAFTAGNGHPNTGIGLTQLGCRQGDVAGN